jgi:hypothetical protein
LAELDAADCGLVMANTINVGADLGAIAAAINLLVPSLPIAPLVLPIAVDTVNDDHDGSLNSHPRRGHRPAARDDDADVPAAIPLTERVAAGRHDLTRSLRAAGRRGDRTQRVMTCGEPPSCRPVSMTQHGEFVLRRSGRPRSLSPSEGSDTESGGEPGSQQREQPQSAVAPRIPEQLGDRWCRAR